MVTNNNTQQDSVMIGDYTIKHLEWIQGIITRMNQNSFQIKNWAIILNSALLGVAVTSGHGELTLLALISALLFWALDSYYLNQERKYRGLYDQVRHQKEGTKNLFSMNTDPFRTGRYRFMETVFSITLTPLYTTLIGIQMTAFFILGP